MDSKEMELLKADLKAEIIKELTGQDLRTTQDTSAKPLSQLYLRYKEPLYQKYGTVTYAQVWDCVRKLATFRSGHRYVRDLLPSEEKEASEFAESVLGLMGVELKEESL